MQYRRAAPLRTWLAILGAVVVARVLAGMLAQYGSYLPSPDFRSDFLLGREESFERFGYRFAFAARILTGPPALVLALVLANASVRRRWPQWHGRLGHVEAILVGLFLAPSGLIMALEPLPMLPSAERLIAGLGFATLAITTGTCAALGFAAGRRHRLADHGRWMARLVALLLSAVVMRVMGGAAEICCPDAGWTYAASAWGSWIVPLLAGETLQRTAARPELVTVLQSPGDHRPME